MTRPIDTDLARRMGQQMQRLRVRMNLTQKEAAAKIGMHFNQWAKYERGEKTMPLRWVQAIESAYDIAFDIEPPAPTTKAPTHPPEYYKGMLEAGRRLSAAGQQIVEEAMDGLTASVTTPSADRLAAASGAVAVRGKAKTAPRTRHRTG